MSVAFLNDFYDEKAKDKKQRDRASELSAQIDEWANDGQLDPAIAQAAANLLAPLSNDG